MHLELDEQGRGLLSIGEGVPIVAQQDPTFGITGRAALDSQFWNEQARASGARCPDRNSESHRRPQRSGRGSLFGVRRSWHDGDERHPQYGRAGKRACAPGSEVWASSSSLRR